MNDIDELTRQGKNICEKCSNPKRMYYVPWCPICEKPQFKTIKELNFMQCMYHLEALGHKGIKERMIEHFRYEFRNDSYFSFYGLPENPDDDDYYVQTIKDFQLIQDTFGIKNDERILFFVSW